MKKFTILFSLLVGFFLFSNVAMANKTSVKLVAPEKADKGSEVTIKIEVTHKGNSKMHFTDWVVVKVNGEEFKKWEYTKKERPEDENFTVEFTLKVEDAIEIEATGNCNMHGSTGSDTVKIALN